MKIAIICPNFPPATFEGGISHYSAQLAESLLCRGHKIYAFISTEFAQPRTNLKENNGVELIRISGPWNCFSIPKIKKAAKEKKIDALILQYSPVLFKTSFRIKWAVTRFPCQKITAFHTLWGKGFDRLLGLLILWGSFKIIATNSEIMAILGKRLPLFLKKTEWIPIATNILPVKFEDNHKAESHPIISYFGMLYPGKGLDLILDTLEKLKKENVKFLFKFIGGKIIYYQSYEDYFQKELKRRNLEDMVAYLGYIPSEDVSIWLKKSRFIFLPYDKGLSDRRGTLMAALAHGKPVLTSPPIVPMSIFQNGVNVIWPNEKCVYEYVRLIKRLLHDEKLISELGKGAKQLSNLFSWEKIGKEYEIVLKGRNHRVSNLI